MTRLFTFTSGDITNNVPNGIWSVEILLSHGNEHKMVFRRNKSKGRREVLAGSMLIERTVTGRHGN